MKARTPATINAKSPRTTIGLLVRTKYKRDLNIGGYALIFLMGVAIKIA
jgi:hypothetical protein